MHNIEHQDYPENVNKKEAEESINKYVARQTAGEGGHGLNSSIRWIDIVCEDYNAACEYINNHDSGWYDQLAVKYKEYPRPKEASLKKYNELNLKAQMARKEYSSFEEHNHFKDVKAAFIGCPSCKSKINREIYTTKWTATKANFCPVCREDMRSETMKKKSEAMKAKCDKLSKQAEEEMKKQKAKLKPETRWLVKFEYHT